MKNAAKCDTSCDLQNPVNHQNFERILRFRDMPGSMLVGVSVDTTRPSPPPVKGRGCRGGLCVFRSASRSECTQARERNDTSFQLSLHGVVDGARPKSSTAREQTTHPNVAVNKRLWRGTPSLPTGPLVSRASCPRPLGRPTFVRTSDQARGPAEFKHITKRRKRN